MLPPQVSFTDHKLLHKMQHTCFLKFCNNWQNPLLPKSSIITCKHFWITCSKLKIGKVNHWIPYFAFHFFLGHAVSSSCISHEVRPQTMVFQEHGNNKPIKQFHIQNGAAGITERSALKAPCIVSLLSSLHWYFISKYLPKLSAFICSCYLHSSPVFSGCAFLSVLLPLTSEINAV